MKHKFFHTLIFAFCALISNGEFDFSLNRWEYLKSVTIMRHFEIRNCILVSNYHEGRAFFNVKFFSKETAMISAMGYKGLIDYFQVGIFPNVRTIIIMKEKNLKNILEIFESFDELKLTHRAHRFTWLVFLNSYNSNDGEKLNIPYNCRFLIAFSSEEFEYQITEIYKVKNKFFSIEYDTFDEYILAVPNNFLYTKRMNLSGTELVMNSDKQVINAMKHLTEEEFEKGKEWQILNGIRKMMNFRYGYKIIELVHYRNPKIDGDFSIVPVVFHSDFFKASFMGPMFKNMINWYIKSPKIEYEGDFTQPFHKHLWLLIFSFILFNSLLLNFIKKMLKEKISTAELAFLTLDTFCSQNGFNDLKRSSLRIVCFTLWIVAIFIMALYNATITSFLAISTPQIPFKNLEAFSKTGKYKLMLIEQNFAEYYFKSTNDPLLKYIYNNLSISFDILKDPFSIFEILPRICDGNLAIALTNNDIDNFDLGCEIFKVEKPITFTYSGLLLKDNSPFKEALNYNLISFYTSGIQMKLQKESDAWDSATNLMAENSLKPVEAQQIFQILYLVGGGTVLAAIILILEVCCQKYQNRSTESKTCFKTNSISP